MQINNCELQLLEFKMESLRYNRDGDFLCPRICIIGQSGSGKSFVTREILYQLKDIPCATIICPTDRLNKFYDTMVHSSYIYHKYRSTIVPKILNRQNMILDKNKERVKLDKKEIDPRITFVMDDCMAESHLWLKDENIREIMCQGRHYKITYILTLQYSLGIPPDIRNNFNFVFLMGEDSCINREKLFKHWCSIVPSFKIFEQIFMTVTQNYGCLVINNTIKDSDITKRIFWFRARKLDEFKVGSNKYKNFHDYNFDNEHDKKKNSFNILNFDKKNTLIKVKMLD